MKPDLNVLASEGKIWSAIRRKLPGLEILMRKSLTELSADGQSIVFDEIARQLADAIEMEGDRRCTVMLPNQYGKERCGREFGHKGKCCYERMD